MSTEMLGRRFHAGPRRVSRRSALARAALDRARGVAVCDEALPVGSEQREDRATAGLALCALSPRLGAHIALVALVALVACGELGAAVSQHVVARPGVPTGAQDAAMGSFAEGVVVGVPPVVIGPIKLIPAVTADDLVPAPSQPVELPGPYRTFHQLVGGETLANLASRYGVTVESLVWANGLERGDALVVGQLLRVPYTSGVPYTVVAGDTASTVAERFGVPVEAIASLLSNNVGADLGLIPGSEIFIPGAQPPLAAELLAAAGGAGGIGARRAEPAAVVREAQTNLRTGPSTDHPRVTQLEAGRRVALRARNHDWLEVQLGAARGWIRVDMVDVPAEVVAMLPVSTNFPPPPPRWVWPARGTLTSGFGPRWRRFHNGIDIANRAWTPIVAARTGVVKEAGWCSGYGYCVKIRHDGGMETIYGHLIDRPVVFRGDEVSAGELIGHMGSTYDRAGGGYSTGVHLHFTVLVDGKAVNPLKYLP